MERTPQRGDAITNTSSRENGGQSGQKKLKGKTNVGVANEASKEPREKQMLVASEGSSDGQTCRDFRTGARVSSFKGSRYIDLMMQTIAVLIDEMCCKAFVRICSLNLLCACAMCMTVCFKRSWLQYDQSMNCLLLRDNKYIKCFVLWENRSYRDHRTAP
jgi:hypothetical protein